jgi:hypothetical protein
MGKISQDSRGDSQNSLLNSGINALVSLLKASRHVFQSYEQRSLNPTSVSSHQKTHKVSSYKTDTLQTQ